MALIKKKRIPSLGWIKGSVVKITDYSVREPGQFLALTHTVELQFQANQYPLVAAVNTKHAYGTHTHRPHT